MTALTSPQFTNEEAAVAHLEASRWPDGVNCPHCGSLNVHRMGGKTQAGMFLCNDCRDKFTARTGTVMERSHIPVHKWLLAIHLLSSSKKGMSAHQLHRMLGITYKSAWFLAHRIREAMDTKKPAGMGGAGHQVQADETYYGNTSKRAKHYKKGHSQKSGVVGLVNPATGEARAFAVETANTETVRDILNRNVHRGTTLVTDESSIYKSVGGYKRETVMHVAREYVNKDGFTTNNVENFFGIFKKGMVGVYHFCGEQHLQRYLNEFAFRYSNRSGVGIEDNARALRSPSRASKASASRTDGLTKIRNKKQFRARFLRWRSNQRWPQRSLCRLDYWPSAFAIGLMRPLWRGSIFAPTMATIAF